MAQSYRVVDLRSEGENLGETHVEGVKSPEAAVKQALGLELVRSGAKKDLVAQVYWQIEPGSTNMVRLYSRVATPRRR
nr:hypothetical protein [uncultured Devosia sp.]